MSSHSSRISRGSTRSVVLAATVLVAAALALSLALVSAPTAAADPLADKQAQARKLQVQVDALDEKLSHEMERQRSVEAMLAELQRRVDRATSQYKVARTSYDRAHRRLVRHAIEAYRQGDPEPDIFWALSQAGSFADAADRLTAARQVNAQDATIATKLNRAKAKLARERAQLKELEAEQKVLVKQARKRTSAVNRIATQRKQALASVNADVRAIVEERRRAAAEAAAARSRAIAEAQAQSTARTTESKPEATPFTPAPQVGGSGSGTGAAAVAVAMRYIGLPYVWGGSSPSGFDCSGLVMYSFAQVGVSLPRTTYSQWNAGRHVSMSELQVGDLVFKYGLGHVGIYVGGGNYIHSPQTGDVVKISTVSDGFVGGVRVV